MGCIKSRRTEERRGKERRGKERMKGESWGKKGERTKGERKKGERTGKEGGKSRDTPLDLLRGLEVLGFCLLYSFYICIFENGNLYLYLLSEK